MPHQHTPDLEWKNTPVPGVSAKELLARAEGTAKLIRLEAHSEYPVHQHPDRSEYAYVLEGAPVLFDGEARHPCRPGDFVTFPAKRPHSLGNPSEHPVLLLVGAIFHE
jgi:quercetin dioxygenase-like cupin family protein